VGTRKVVVFQRSCGATTGFSTQASLLAGNASPPAESGNLLSIDDDHGKVPLDGNGRIEVRVAFADESTVTLAYPARSRVFTQVASRDGVTIRHERLESQETSTPPRPPHVTEKSFGPTCISDSDCRDGRECAKWGSFAGANPRRSCELPCDFNRKPVHTCPKGLHCVQFVDDGPYSSLGGVCLPSD
jgi:hypothetical protein